MNFFDNAQLNQLLMIAFTEEMSGEKCAGAASAVGKFLVKHEDALDVGGLGVLALPSLDTMQARHRARMASGGGPVTEEDIEKKRLIKERFHAPIDVAGLGILAGAPLAHRGHH